MPNHLLVPIGPCSNCGYDGGAHAIDCPWALPEEPFVFPALSFAALAAAAVVAVAAWRAGVYP